MKSIVSGVSLLLAVLHLAGISIERVQAQAIIPTPDITATLSGVEQNILLAQVATPTKLDNAFDRENLTEIVPQIEQTWEKQYEDYFRINFSDESITAKDVADTLGKIAVQTGKKPALIYVVPRAKQLELVLITPGNQPIHSSLPGAKSEVLLKEVTKFRENIVDPKQRNSTRYLPAAQQLYRWIVAPLETDLKKNKIDTLIFCMGVGLRTIPLAAFHDGQKFLVEKYSIGRIPAFKLTDTLYVSLKNSQVLAMGASKFKEQNPLPAVPVELSAIAQKLGQGKFFLNQQFTLANLQSQRASEPYKIIHLATHAFFEPGEPSNSYVQLWDVKLTLDKMRQLQWNSPPVELLVLSACRTALGDEQAELGFAGLAVQSGAKSAVASLWSVSDEGTLGLMTEFYQQLKTAPIKAEALRQAQIGMLQGKVHLQDGQLYSSSGKISLPPELAGIQNVDLSHPYYWAAFTLVGSPW